jgi:hypothetical protein
MSVAAQASELPEYEIGITPFDCPVITTTRSKPLANSIFFAAGIVVWASD